jgi:hypothetical protein
MVDKTITLLSGERVVISDDGESVLLGLIDKKGVAPLVVTLTREEALKIAAVLLSMKEDDVQEAKDWETHASHDVELLEKAAYYAYRLLVAGPFPWTLLSEDAKKMWRGNVLADDPFKKDIAEAQNATRKKDIAQLLKNLHTSA